MSDDLNGLQSEKSLAARLDRQVEPAGQDDAGSDNKPIKIMMLAPTMFFADYGCHVRILEEALVLRKLGHRVTILTYPNGRDIAGLDVRRSRGVPFNYRVIVGSSRHKIYLDVLLGIKALGYALRYRPDVIHAHLHEGGLIGSVISKLSGVPLVFDFQGSLTGEMIDHHFLNGEQSWVYKILRWLETLIDQAAPVVLTSSQHSARLLEQEFDVPASRIFPTPDCVNADFFSPAVMTTEERTALRQELAIPPDRKIIVYLGLLTEYQGIDLLLDAVCEISRQRSDFHLLLMGFPEMVYQVRAEEMGISQLITFTGKVPYDEAPRYLSVGDLAVAPKISATEGSGKILNYMSMALPTVAFDMPVSREYLGDWGYYASAVDAGALAAALAQVLDLEPAQRAERGQCLQNRVTKHFSWEPVGRRLGAVYRALVEGKPVPLSAPATESEASSCDSDPGRV